MLMEYPLMLSAHANLLAKSENWLINRPARCWWNILLPRS